ncbi:Dimodular nonribosomal peptide synthase [compost metagenome]
MKLLHHEKIGVHDNFFEIGGDSLLAVQLLTMIRSRFHLDLSLRNILNAPTVAGISSILNTFLNIQSVVLDEDSIEKVEF